jgi:hypothetical protein
MKRYREFPPHHPIAFAAGTEVPEGRKNPMPNNRESVYESQNRLPGGKFNQTLHRLILPSLRDWWLFCS